MLPESANMDARLSTLVTVLCDVADVDPVTYAGVLSDEWSNMEPVDSAAVVVAVHMLL